MATPVVAFHGTSDEYILFDGGKGKGYETLPTPAGRGLG
jgi:hypothetical protein